MHRLNGGYAQWFNRRHGFDGHLFQSRFHSVLLESDWHLLELSRYIVLNPVRAAPLPRSGGLAVEQLPSVAWRSRSAPSSSTVDWLLEQFGADPGAPATAFRRFVGEALAA